MIISRDKDTTGTIIIWSGAELDDLTLWNSGFWDAPSDCDTDPILEVNAKDFKKLFVNERECPVKLPRRGTKTYIPPFILRI